MEHWTKCLRAWRGPALTREEDCKHQVLTSILPNLVSNFSGKSLQSISGTQKPLWNQPTMWAPWCRSAPDTCGEREYFPQQELIGKQSNHSPTDKILPKYKPCTLPQGAVCPEETKVPSQPVLPFQVCLLKTFQCCSYIKTSSCANEHQTETCGRQAEVPCTLHCVPNVPLLSKQIPKPYR